MSAGLETLFSSVQEDVNNREDLIVCALHWCMITNGFKCIGLGEEPPRDSSPRRSELLPSGWSTNDGAYSLLYRPDRSPDTYLLKIIKSGRSLLVHLLSLKDENVGSMTLNMSQYTTRDMNRFDRAYKDVDQLHQKFKNEVISGARPVAGRRRSDGSPSRAQSQRGREREDDPLREPPRRPLGQSHPHWGGMADPFSIGTGDLDPLSAGGSGGMLMDPTRAGFGFPDRGIDPSIGIPGRLPRGAIPPGARFDPFGPPDPGPGMDPRNGRRMGPDPDHLPPPGYDDQFM